MGIAHLHHRKLRLIILRDVCEVGEAENDHGLFSLLVVAARTRGDDGDVRLGHEREERGNLDRVSIIDQNESIKDLFTDVLRVLCRGFLLDYVESPDNLLNDDGFAFLH